MVVQQMATGSTGKMLATYEAAGPHGSEGTKWNTSSPASTMLGLGKD